jgi:hypothetical protein
MSKEHVLAKRENEFEAKFAHDEELAFRILARRDKLFAAEIAQLGGMSARAEEAFVDEALSLHGGPDHDGTLIQLAHHMLMERSPGHERLGEKLARFGEAARADLMGKPG